MNHEMLIDSVSLILMPYFYMSESATLRSTANDIVLAVLGENQLYTRKRVACTYCSRQLLHGECNASWEYIHLIKE